MVENPESILYLSTLRCGHYDMLIMMQCTFDSLSESNCCSDSVMTAALEYLDENDSDIQLHILGVSQIDSVGTSTAISESN